MPQLNFIQYFAAAQLCVPLLQVLLKVFLDVADLRVIVNFPVAFADRAGVLQVLLWSLAAFEAVYLREAIAHCLAQMLALCDLSDDLHFICERLLLVEHVGV